MSNAKVNFDLPTGIENLDITVNFTSKIYPVVSKDALTSQAGEFGFRVMHSTVEALGPTALVTGLTLKEPLESTTVVDEAVGPTATITALTLDEVLVSTTVEDEAVGPTATITALTLESKLVSTTMEDEAIGPTATITGLELS